MGSARRSVAAAMAVLVFCGLFVVRPQHAAAQFAGFGFTSSFELSPSVQIEDLEGTDVKASLARLNALLADKKWDEAVESLRKIAEDHGDRVIGLDRTALPGVAPAAATAEENRRFVNVRDYCNLRCTLLPAEALALYRARVDQVAARWYRDGVVRRDERPLTNIIEQSFCSTYGDKALLALGELALERGQYDRARAYWEQISPLLRDANGRPMWQRLYGVHWAKNGAAVAAEFQHRDRPPAWLAFPDTSLDVAAVRARLVLASILEGSLPRAQQELELFRRLHPQAAGPLAGHEGPYQETLANLLREAAQWPVAAPREDWRTYAGNFARNRVLPNPLQLSGRPTWEVSLAAMAPPPAPVVRPGRWMRMPVEGVSDDGLEFFPVLVGPLVLLCNQQQVFAFDARTGKAAWPSPDGVPGQIFPGGGTAPDPRFSVENAVGRARYSLTAHGDMLYARLGSPVTGRPGGVTGESDPTYLVCLNLRKQGSLEWKYPRDNDRLEFDDGHWTLEGPPVCDGQNVYIGMRHSTFRPEAHVAALDALTGKLLWRKRICAADTPAHGLLNEITNNLLTLQDGTLYYNTNLGAAAALDTRDGRIRWAYRYQRVRSGDLKTPASHFLRDISPCVYSRGLVMVAPSDSPTIMALDATTGALAWTTFPVKNDRPGGIDEDHPTFLLGVAGDSLIATGRGVW
ncbi:MAG: PQQ-like beta-propeller repeat protein, partial [Planctomycetia bacterium]|nr:PQQ-like beta-propeller repeat protein [Planctomycetia bacterium]